MDKVDADKLFNMLKESMDKAGWSCIDRTKFDEILKFNDLCFDLIEKNGGSYEFPFVYLTGKLFNRLTPESRVSFLAEFKKELSEWRE